MASSDMMRSRVGERQATVSVDFTRYVGVERDSVACPLNPKGLDGRKVSSGGTIYPDTIRYRKHSIRRRVSQSDFTRKLSEIRKDVLTNVTGVQGSRSNSIHKRASFDKQLDKKSDDRTGESNKSDLDGLADDEAYQDGTDLVLPAISPKFRGVVKSQRRPLKHSYSIGSGPLASWQGTSGRPKDTMESLPTRPKKSHLLEVHNSSEKNASLDDIAEDASDTDDNSRHTPQKRRNRSRELVGMNENIKNTHLEHNSRRGTKYAARSGNSRSTHSPTRRVSTLNRGSFSNTVIDGRRRTDLQVPQPVSKTRRGTWTYENEVQYPLVRFKGHGEVRGLCCQYILLCL